MTIDWDRLAQPFPPDEIKHRPGAAKWHHKQTCEGARCRVTRDEDMHHQFSYVDARAVAERLDEIVTPAGWQFTCSVIPGSDVVKGRLEIAIDEGRSVVREDHGYPNSDRDDEPIKAATSDALKRCAVLFGIGRHLYEDNKPPTNGSGRGAPPSRPSAAPPPSVASKRPAGAPASVTAPDPYDDIPNDWDANLAPVSAPNSVLHDTPPEDSADNAVCPEHKRPWKTNSRGYYCSGKTDGEWCKRQPPKKWVAGQELVGARGN